MAAYGGYKAAKLLFGPLLGVDLSSGGSRVRAFASERGLQECFRSDVMDLIIPRRRADIAKSRMGLAHELLAILIDPRRLFEFAGFVEFFAKEIIPTQLLIRLEGDLVLFNPARIDVFGNGQRADQSPLNRHRSVRSRHYSVSRLDHNRQVGASIGRRDRLDVERQVVPFE